MGMCFLLVFSLLTSFLLPNIADASSLPRSNQIAIQEEYIVSLQSEQGYLTMTPTNTRINPYFNNIALWAIADNPNHASIVKKWVQWYLTHLNAPDKFGVTGSIYDYTVTVSDEKVKATEDYDSSDSYAATFISLLRIYYDATKDKEFLFEIEPSLELVVRAIYSTRDPSDGLTYAKINYKIKYLMDNLEVWKGLNDWAYLLSEVYQRPDDSDKIIQDALLIERSLQMMWDENRKNFAFAKDEQGNYFQANISKFYPDYTAQLMAIAFELTTPEQTSSIWSGFNDQFPKWTRLGHPDSFPWSLMVYAGAKAGDWDKVNEYINSIELTYGTMGFPWPWHSSEAGWYLLTLKMLPIE